MISQDIHGKGGCGLPCGYDCNGACFAPPADAQAALEAYGREKAREGMQRAADIAYAGKNSAATSDHRGQIKHAILAEMETLK